MRIEEYERSHYFEEDFWWYQGRRELILDLINRIEPRENVLRILDAGCGTGLNLKYLERYGDGIGLDISPEALKFSKSRGNNALICASADRLPFKSNSFDILCALDLLEHISEDSSTVKEFYRVLKYNGYLIITVPAFQILWSNHDIALQHKRRYNKSDLVNILKLPGIVIEKITYWNSILFPVVALVRLFRKGYDKDAKTDLKEMPGPLNKILLHLLRFENLIVVKNIALPVGVSILCICRKDRDCGIGMAFEDAK